MTRGKIIDAAVDLFEAVGYGDAAHRHHQAGGRCHQGAFYYHFEGKDQVADAIIDEGRCDSSRPSSTPTGSRRRRCSAWWWRPSKWPV